MDERISVNNLSFFKSHSHHIQRYEFAGRYCRGKRVVDAGCGTGYGSAYLARDANADEVVGVDISTVAVDEARRYYERDRLRYLVGDVERLSEVSGLEGKFDAVVNLENIEHLTNPGRFLEGAQRLLSDGGVLITSTPNGELTARDADGKISNPHHVREFTALEFRELLSPLFSQIEMFGQWLAPAGRYRQVWDRMVFDHLIEQYYSPGARLWRATKRLLGKPSASPPEFIAAGSSYPGEYTIRPLAEAPYPWPPEVVLAVCQTRAANGVAGAGGHQ